MDRQKQSIRLLVTGSPYHAVPAREMIFTGPRWQTEYFDLAGLRRRPLRLLKFLA